METQIEVVAWSTVTKDEPARQGKSEILEEICR
jgi:hypothetical protein